MNKHLLFLVGLFSLCTASFAQSSNYTKLFVIDSVPVIKDPDENNQITDADIADVAYLKNKDSLKYLGLEKYDEVTYVFTKEYRNRPDSLKNIPSLLQMEIKTGKWNLHDMPYTGKYINYYYCGKKQDEGILVNGKLNGELKVYFQNGQLKSVERFIDGIENGVKYEYYKNGVLKFKVEYIAGKANGAIESYFPNGNIESSNAIKKGITIDTLTTTYYSTGKIRTILLGRNGKVIPIPNFEKINDLRCKYQASINEGNTKKAIKYSSKLIEIDSNDIDAYSNKGIALFREYLFDEAIAAFDKALKLEPFLGAALGYRALARLKKYQFINTATFTKEHKLGLLYAWVTVTIPNKEQEKICSDFQQAGLLGINELFGKKIISEAISFYCNKNISRIN